MEMNIGEVLDRYTIEARKVLYGHGDEEILRQIEQELRNRFGNIPAELFLAGARLGIANSAIAELEWQIRARQDLSLEEIGRRAKAIRVLNGKRVDAKNWAGLVFDGKPAVIAHYGKGDDLPAAKLTFDMQEPRCAR